MGAVKLLLGGSPCTYWSIAQSKNREVTASGKGWELFRNYAIARDKYKPDYFLYENNKSMAKAIREQITAVLGVEPVLINSALVSAQNRERLYWCGRRTEAGTYERVEIPQPEDRGIMLADVLENGLAWREKAFTLRASHSSHGMHNILRYIKMGSGCFSSTGVAAPVVLNGMKSGKSRTIDAHMCKLENILIRRVNSPNKNKQQYDCITVPGTRSDASYEVCGGYISIDGERYPIKLPDGYYIIRKPSLRECARLQTVPEDYEFPVSRSQAYKMLGNGWTVDVIAHILSHFEGIASKPVEVLSMYDGMSCGQIALNKIGADVREYRAMEIDKFAIACTQVNFPNTIQLGDAFQVRDEGWYC